MMMRTYNCSMWEMGAGGLEVQDQLPLCSKFKTSLSYMSSCLKTKHKGTNTNLWIHADVYEMKHLHSIYTSVELAPQCMFDEHPSKTPPISLHKHMQCDGIEGQH